MGASNLKLVFISSTWDCTTFHNFLPMFKKKIQKLAGLWLAGEVVNHVGIYGSKAAEGLSAFQRRSCRISATSPRVQCVKHVLSFSVAIFAAYCPCPNGNPTSLVLTWQTATWHRVYCDKEHRPHSHQVTGARCTEVAARQSWAEYSSRPTTGAEQLWVRWIQCSIKKWSYVNF